MAEAMIDDIKKLLDGDFGDDRILKDIYRACKNGEVISNYERKYVRDLTERYLKTNPLEDASAPTPDKSVTPDVILPEKARAQAEGAPGAYGTYASPPPPDPRHRDHHGHYEQQQQERSPDGGGESVRLIHSTTKKTGGSKGKIVAILAGVIIVAVVVAGAAALLSSDNGGGPVDVTVGTGVTLDPPAPGEFSVRTDLESYAGGDLISLSGWSGADGPVSLLIENPSDSVVWRESVRVSEDGTYSTLAIAGIRGGWTEYGTFVVRADNGVDEVESEFRLAN
ncbi:MAG: hypothetical protein J4F28_04125 [Nitrosopumilaceae archaeon]|nr:hypothetical protein [Nitrosopumilaceae archaeon]